MCLAPRPLPPLLALALAATLSGCAGGAGDAGPWPQWRGGDGSGLVHEGTLPESWGPEAGNLRFKAAVPGVGNSSPIVGSDAIYLTTAEVSDERVERSLVAVDPATGAIRWQTAIESGPPEAIHRINSYAGPTPATDGRAVFAFFGAVLAAVDLEGQLVWRREVDPHYAELSHYGAASSLVLTDGAVIAVRDREDAEHGVGWMGAFDKATGEPLWRNEWDDTCCSYSTPLVSDRGHGPEVLFIHAGRIAAYDPATGDELWRSAVPLNQPVTSPVLAGDLLVVFSGADRVRNGSVMKLSGGGAATTAEVLWETRQMIPQVSSPVVVGDLLFTVIDGGVLVCYDLATGRIHWKRRLEGSGFRASLLAGDGKVYASDAYGRTSVVAAEPKFRLLALNEIGEPGTASPAWGEGCLLLRSDHHLFCIEPAASGVEPA